MSRGLFDGGAWASSRILRSSSVRRRASIVVEKRKLMKNRYLASKSVVSDAETIQKHGVSAEILETKESKVKEKESNSKDTTPTPPPDDELLLSSDEQVETEEIVEDVFTLYSNNIGQVTPIINGELVKACEQFGEDWVREAIKQAARQQHRSMAYIQGVMKGMAKDGGPASPKDIEQARDRYDKGEFGHMVNKDFNNLDPARRKRLETTPGMK